MDSGLKTTKISDENYPEILKKTKNPPQKLYYRGKICKKEKVIAIIGSRTPTAYGKQVALEFSRFLAKAGLTIVSGLAIGIDSLAHQGALEAKARTIAVLGSGVDDPSITPPRNKKLAKEILENNGLILSEYPPGSPGLPRHFPERNRIIAGLSLAVIIIEAKEKSGALITADYAIRFKRKVFAVPGSIYSPQSQGCHKLIQKGAILVASPKEILERLKLFSQKQEKLEIQFDSPLEKLIYNLLQRKPLSIEKIIEKSNQPTEKVLQALTLLEIEEKIYNLGGNIYGIKKH
jgi:DNA processing protein